MTSAHGPAGDPTAPVHRVHPQDAARMRALRLEMLADAPLAFLETVAEAAARRRMPSTRPGSRTCPGGGSRPSSSRTRAAG